MSVRAFIRSSTVELWQPELLITYHHYFILKEMIWPINTPYRLFVFFESIQPHKFYTTISISNYYHCIHYVLVEMFHRTKEFKFLASPTWIITIFLITGHKVNQSNLLVYYLSESGHLVNQWLSFVHEMSNWGTSKPVVSLALKMVAGG